MKIKRWLKKFWIKSGQLPRNEKEGRLDRNPSKILPEIYLASFGHTNIQKKAKMQTVKEIVQELNKKQGQGYKWPAKIDGSTEDVIYKGNVILKGNPEGLSYCCGLVAEVFFKWAIANDIDLGSYSDVMQIRRGIFIAQNPDLKPLYELKGIVDATSKFTREVKLEDAKPYSFAQLWRNNGSGHTVIILEVLKRLSGEVVGVKYWSTQPSTQGIGERTEYFEGKNPITNIYICETT